MLKRNCSASREWCLLMILVGKSWLNRSGGLTTDESWPLPGERRGCISAPFELQVPRTFDIEILDYLSIVKMSLTLIITLLHHCDTIAVPHHCCATPLLCDFYFAVIISVITSLLCDTFAVHMLSLEAVTM